MALGPEILWTWPTTTERDAQVVSKLELGGYGKVLAGSGTLFQAVAAGTGSSCWAQVASSTDDPADLDARLDILEADYTSRLYGNVSPIVIAAGLTLVENTAYWVYAGYFPYARTVKRIRAHIVTGGTGAQTAEMALATSPAAPNRANQTLTKLVADGSIGDLTGTGLVDNGQDLNQAIAAGTHLWIGIRTAMATNEPVLLAVGNDFGQGAMLSTAAAGALTGAGPWTGAVIAQALTAQAPVLGVTLD